MAYELADLRGQRLARDPEQILKDLMATRDPLYREIADHVIDTDGCSPRTVAQKLVRELS
jgi:shikimate kinase